MIAKFLAILVIMGSFLGGFVIMGGNLLALWHPSELLVILGIALGTFMASTPVSVWKKTMILTGSYFKGARVSHDLYAELISLMDELSRFSRANGMLSLEPHLTDPESSSIFNKYPLVMKHNDLQEFIVSNFNYLLLNPPVTVSFQDHLHLQIDNIINSMQEVPRAVGKVADWLPGFGIVAAVMGVILTMELLAGEMDVAAIGAAIGAALVGTLTGVFMAFAVLAPYVHAIEIMIRQDRSLLETAATYLEAYELGLSPNLAAEIGMQSVPPEFMLPRE